MIKAVIFDLDGVLANTADIHDLALDAVLQSVDPSYHITEAEHLKYGTKPTLYKLEQFFTKRHKFLSPQEYAQLYTQKTLLTSKMIDDQITRQAATNVFQIIGGLKHRGYKLAVCSNAGRSFVTEVLEKLHIHFMFNTVLTNRSVSRSKPYPDIYLQAMLDLGVGPHETLIFEDSFHGVKAAFDSGAHVAIVPSPDDLTDDWVAKEIAACDSFVNAPPLRCNRLTVVVPMAGDGTRFEKAGYTDHKPMIKVGNDTILGLTMKSLANIDAHFVFIVQKRHYERYDLGSRLRLLKPGCEIVQIDGITEGAACTILKAEQQINTDNPLIVINSDNLIIWDREHLLHMLSSKVDGGIMVFKDTNPKWSFAKEGPDGFVCEVAEKRAISNLATCGLYYWSKGSDFVKYAHQMIAKNIRVNNEFYLCPVYNEAILDGKHIKTYFCVAMWGLGTPSDVEHYVKAFKE